MTEWKSCTAVERRPGKLSGTWTFAGTRVPVSALFENLGSGATVEQFLGWFPGVEEWKVRGCSSTRSQRPQDSGEIVKILFDQGTPVPLRQHLAGHSVDTASEKGWSDLDNGDLIDLAEQEGYEVFVTTDQGMRYQQNLAAKRLSSCSPRHGPRSNTESKRSVLS